MYTGMFCRDALRGRIAAIYSNDGPGFSTLAVKEDMLHRLDGILQSFVPQASIVGMLMEYDVKHTVVHSRQIGFQQHDLYNWDIKGPDFVRLRGLKAGSLFVDKTLQEWFAKLEPERRAAFIDAVFEIFAATNASSFNEIKQNLMKNTSIILKRVKELDPETRKMVMDTLHLLKLSAKEKIPEFLPKIKH